MTTTPAKTRKSANTKARDALSVAERKVVILEGRRARAEAEVTKLTGEVHDAITERDYLAKNPALVVGMAPLVDPNTNDESTGNDEG